MGGIVMLNLAEYSVKEGIITWKNALGQFHKDDFSPARIFEDRKEEYFYYGTLYYVVYSDGTKHIVDTSLYKKLSQCGTQENRVAA